MVSHPWLRAAFFFLWMGGMLWSAFEHANPWLRWAWLLLAGLGGSLGLHFVRVALRQRPAR